MVISLVDRGTQQDYLAQETQAAQTFAEAMHLDAGNEEALEAASVNALMRHEDSKAIELATQALKLAPGSEEPRYTRARAYYLDNRAAEASGDAGYQAWADTVDDDEVKRLLLLNGREETIHGERAAQARALLAAD